MQVVGRMSSSAATSGEQSSSTKRKKLSHDVELVSSSSDQRLALPVEAVSTNNGLSAETRGRALNFLPHSCRHARVRRAVATSRLFATEAARHVDTLNLFCVCPEELSVEAARPHDGPLTWKMSTCTAWYGTTTPAMDGTWLVMLALCTTFARKRRSARYPFCPLFQN